MKDKIKKFFIKDDVKAFVKENNSEESTVEVGTEADDKICEEGVRKGFYEYTLGEIADIKDKTGSKDILIDILSEEFAMFAEGREGGLEEIYNAFSMLKAVMLPQDKTARGQTGQDSRMHSGFSGAVFKDVSSGLTKRQMDMARSAGMSFREYEELLNSAPTKTKNRI